MPAASFLVRYSSDEWHIHHSESYIEPLDPYQLRISSQFNFLITRQNSTDNPEWRITYYTIKMVVIAEGVV